MARNQHLLQKTHPKCVIRQTIVFWTMIQLSLPVSTKVGIGLSREIMVTPCLVNIGGKTWMIYPRSMPGWWYMDAMCCLDHMATHSRLYRQDPKEYKASHLGATWLQENFRSLSMLTAKRLRGFTLDFQSEFTSNSFLYVCVWLQGGEGLKGFFPFFPGLREPSTWIPGYEAPVVRLRPFSGLELD